MNEADQKGRERAIGFIIGASVMLLLLTCAGCSTITPGQKKAAAAVGTIILIGTIQAHQSQDNRVGINPPDCAANPRSCQ